MTLNEKEFLLTLPSNSSFAFFPDNTTSTYITKLQQAIDLTNVNWVVALSEVHIPWSFYNVGENEYFFIYKVQNDEVVSNTKIDILPGYYPTIQNILDQIPSDLRIMHYDNERNQVFVMQSLVEGESYLMGMTPSLRSILGYTSTSSDNWEQVVYYQKEEEDTSSNIIVGADEPCNIDHNIPSEIFICTDIVKHQPTIGKILRNVSVSEYNYGGVKSFLFQNPHYVRVVKKYFDSIEINLKNSQGENLPFQFGTSSVTLHFKQV